MKEQANHRRLGLAAAHGIAVGLCCAAALLGCSNTDASQPGSGGAGAGTGGAGAGATGLRPFTPPNVAALGAGQMLLTASGESLAQSGYAFPPTSADAPAFVDGWNIHFDHLLVTFDHVTLSSDPDRVPGDQSQAGSVLAEARGPWAVDLSQASATDIQGKESDETAIPFAAITSQSGGRAFGTDGTRYAVGFEAVAADPNAINVNMGADAAALYQTMVSNGCAVFYAGTATFNGENCTPAPQDPELVTIPTAVRFSLCFRSPTRYVNCQNQDNTGLAIGEENFQRGVAFPTNTYVTGEVTFHTDHPFWEATAHDSPAHFDPFAAQGVGQAGTPEVTLEELVGLDYTAFTDAAGAPVHFRSCVDTSRYPTPPQAQLFFDPHGVPAAVNSDPSTGLRDFYDFATYNQSTQGHWNGEDGLCAVVRQYPSPH